MTLPNLCNACHGDTHTSCSGSETNPCGCGCLASAASLHRSGLAKLAVHNQPMHSAVQRRIEQMRTDGKQPPE